MYVLDTDHMSLLEWGGDDSSPLRERLADLDRDQLFVSIVSYEEQIGPMDLRIASIVLANDMVLLTRNTVDFERIPGLRFEDWSS